jgi:hypothetical protein
MTVKKNGNVVEVDGMVVHLARPELAAFLAWIFPGAGHYYQRRYGKAAMFSISIMAIYILGMVIGSGRVVYVSWVKEDWRWQYVCQAGIGLPAMPALLQAWHLQSSPRPYWNGFMARPKDTSVLSDWHKESSAGFDLGSLYTMIAGLLNILVIFDAASGPLPLPIHTKKSGKDKKTEDEAKPENAKNAEPTTAKSAL